MWFPDQRFFDETQTLDDPLPIQHVTLRQGDRLTAFAMVIEDENAQPIDLTGARCFLSLRPISATNTRRMLDDTELTIEDAVGGVVSHDWQAIETLQGQPGLYDVLIDVRYDDGTSFVVPSRDQAATVNLRSSIVTDRLVVDQTGALVRDLDGNFVMFDPANVQAGDMVLTEDGSYQIHA